MSQATQDQWFEIQDRLKEIANTDPDFIQLNLNCIEYINRSLETLFPPGPQGAPVKLVIKGSNAYSLMYRYAVVRGFPNIDADLLTIKGDWDTEVKRPETVSVEETERALQQVLGGLGTVLQEQRTTIDPMLQRIQETINTRPTLIGGLPHRMEVVYDAPDSRGGIQFARVEKERQYILLRLMVPFNAVRMSTPPVITRPSGPFQYFFAEMLDIVIVQPTSDLYWFKKFPIHMRVAPIPPGLTHIYTMGFDDMFVDLHWMAWEKRPTTAFEERKLPRRQQRFAKLLTSLFCRPEFFPLRLPIQNPKFLDKLFSFGTKTPISGRGPLDVCNDSTKFSDPADYTATQDSNLIESIFRECPPDVLRNYKEVFVSTCRSGFRLTEEQTQSISTLYDRLQTAEACVLLKELFMLWTSWYANDYFRTVGLVYLISYMEHKDINRYHRELECAIKEFDMRHYLTMSQNFEAILHLVNEICQTINSRFESVGNTMRINARIQGGGAFAYHLNSYLKNGIRRPGNPEFIGTADLDISIISNIDTTDALRADMILRIFDTYAPRLQALAAVQSDTGQQFPFHYVNDREDTVRRVRHVGYDLPSVQVNGYTIPQTTQHVFEFFFYKQAQNLDSTEYNTAVTSRGELPYVKIYRIPNMMRETLSVSRLPNMETYKRKKYALRNQILQQITMGQNPVDTMQQLFGVSVCSANTRALYNRWISQSGLQQYLSEVPVATPVVTPQIAPVATPVVTPQIAPVATPVVTPQVAPVATPVVTPQVAPVAPPITTVPMKRERINEFLTRESIQSNRVPIDNLGKPILIQRIGKTPSEGGLTRAYIQANTGEVFTDGKIALTKYVVDLVIFKETSRWFVTETPVPEAVYKFEGGSRMYYLVPFSPVIDEWNLVPGARKITTKRGGRTLRKKTTASDSRRRLPSSPRRKAQSSSFSY